MGMYAVNIDAPTSINNISSIATSQNSKILTLVTIVTYLLIFVIGLYFVIKKVGNLKDANNTLKIISFIIPIVGIILYFLKLKSNKDLAICYLKAGVIGIVTYLFIAGAGIIINVIHWNIN